MRVNLVFEGGGVLGISFVGAYEALHNNGYEVVKCAGTSAGSIIASLITANYTAKEMIETLNSTDFKQFLSNTKLSKIFLLGKPLSLIFNNGIYGSECIEKWMTSLLNKKGINTFKDIMTNGKSPLKIIVADITTRRMLILPDDLVLYGIKPEDFSIAKAVRMSCTIPYFYTPVKVKYGNKVSYIVDGGLLSTYPIWVFDLEGEPKRPTFGLKIKDECSYTSLGKKNIIAFTKDIINAPINMDEMFFVRDKNLIRTIIINNNHEIKSTNFKLKKDSVKHLYKSGFDSVNEFLNKWNFSDYIKHFI